MEGWGLGSLLNSMDDEYDKLLNLDIVTIAGIL
jgi:hypothetical protein